MKDQENPSNPAKTKKPVPAEPIDSNKKNESLVSAILSTTKTAIFWKDSERRFLGVNQAFLDYYGFSDESVLLGKTDEDMGWHPNPGPYENDEERVLREGISTYRVKGQCYARGELRDIVASKAPLIVDGKIVGLVGSFDDITLEDQQAKQISNLNKKLEKQIADHDQFMTLSDVGILTISLPDYRISEYNDSVCATFGFSRDEFNQKIQNGIGTLLTGAYHKTFVELVEAVEQAKKENKRTFSLALCLPGSEGPLWISGAFSFSEEKNIPASTSLVVIYRDITDAILSKDKLKKAEKEIEKLAQIKEENNRLSLMINGVPSGLGALRIKNGIPNDNLQLNRYFFERADLAATGEDGQIETRLFPECLHPEERERFKNAFSSLLNEGKELSGDYRIRSKKDGSYTWVHVRASISQVSAKEKIAYFAFADITETKQAEAELREGQRFYKEAVRAAELTTWTYDILKHEIIMSDDANVNPYQWTSKRRITHVPESVLDQIEEKDQPLVKALYQSVDEGKDGSCEFWFKTENGREPRCERMSYIVQKDETGKPVRAIGLGRNITVEKKAEERYERELGYLRDTNDNNLIAKGHYNLTKDQVLEYTTKNDSFFRIKPGTTYSDAVKALTNLAYQKDEHDLLADKLNRENLLKRYQKGLSSDSLLYRRRRKGQLPIWIAMDIHTYTMPETGDIELFSYAYDVSEKREVDELMSLIAEADFDYVGYLFPETKMFEFIKKSEKISFPEVRVLTPYDECLNYVRKNFVSPEEAEQFSMVTSLPNILKNLEEKERYVATYRRVNKDQVTCKQISYVWLDRAAQVILVVRSDVTAAYERDQKQLAAIESAKLDADKANEAKSAFLSSMSHDIRTPLNGVIGFTELALKEPDPLTQRHYLEEVDSSAKLMLDLVNDVLELSRIESGKSVNAPEVTNPSALIPVVVTALRPSAIAKGLTFDANFAYYPTEMLWCDRLKIQRIVLNLLSNAIKYTPEGGRVALHFENGTVDGCLKWLIFTVEDNGIGMSEEFMKRMYEPFSQEKRSEASKVPGTGLGLAIVKKFVEILDGTIEATSLIHQGTHFRVVLPVRKAEEGVVENNAAIDLSSLKGKRVLLCEDNALNSEIACMILKEKGVSVDWAENGQIGLKRFEASAPHTYAGILMDLRMPVMDGFEASKAIRALKRDDAKKIPIIAMTADVFEESIRSAREAGMNAYITKPIIPEKFFETLTLYLKPY